MSNSRRAFFVAGTDTGVGKTYVAAGLLEAAARAGLSTAALKPVASGCELIDGQLRNEDALLLQRHCSPPMQYEQINPVALELAIAPHIAAAEAGRSVTVSRLEGFCRAVLMQRRDFTVVEGAGGWRVPLNSREYLSELARVLELPVILVVGLRLGCINHAVLSAEAVRRDGLQVAGWVANQLEPEMPFAEQNLATLSALLEAPCLGTLPYDPQFSRSSSCASLLDLNVLF